MTQDKRRTGLETVAAQSHSADKLKPQAIQSRASVERALDIARQLARWGVPIFLARPDLDKSQTSSSGAEHSVEIYVSASR